jgi:hypothetical protein
MATFLICLWGAAILARFACAAALLKRDLALTYWPLFLVSGIGGVMHAYGFVVFMRDGYAGYFNLWRVLEPYQVTWDALLMVSAVRAGARNFRRAEQLIRWLSAILLILAGAITLLISQARVAFPDGLIYMALFAERNRAIFCVAFTALAVFAFTRISHGQQLRRNSLLILWVSMAFFTASFLGNQIAVVAQSYAGAAIAQVFLMGGPLLCFGLWTSKLTLSGEMHRENPPPKAGDIAASEDSLREAKRRLDEMRRRGR